MDIVERLRAEAEAAPPVFPHRVLVLEAADEIDKLRLMPDDNREQLINIAKQHGIVLSENERLRDEIERLRDQAEYWRKCNEELCKTQDELRKDLAEAEKYNGWHQLAMLEIERLRDAVETNREPLP